MKGVTVRISLNLFFILIVSMGMGGVAAQDVSDAISVLKSAEKGNPLLIIETDSTGGSGFVAKLGVDLYIITNQHVIFGARKLRIKNVAGVRLKPMSIELHPELDLARMKFVAEGGSEIMALELASNVAVGAPVYIFGNNLGGGVLTYESGKIMGVSGDMVEYSNSVTTGSSGSAVINENGQAVAAVSHAVKRSPTLWNADTRYVDVRKFGLRVSENDGWQAVSPNVFFAQCDFINDYNRYVYDLLDVTTAKWEKETHSAWVDYFGFTYTVYTTTYDLRRKIEGFDLDKSLAAYSDDTICTDLAQCLQGIKRVVYPPQSTQMKGVKKSETADHVAIRSVESKIEKIVRNLVAMTERIESAKWSSAFLKEQAEHAIAVEPMLIDQIQAWARDVIKVNPKIRR